MPNYAPDGALGTEQKGLLSPIGDGLGQVVDKGLKPVGYLVGQVGNPSGDAITNVRKQARKEVGQTDEDDKDKPDSEKPGGESIGGKTQTGSNPLGL